MNKFFKLLLLSIFTAGIFLFVTACGNNDVPPTQAPPPATPEYTITFMVNGVPTQITVKEGVTPVFEGSTDKPEDTSGYYVFKGWDKEITPATEDTTYTAQYDFSQWIRYQVKYVYKVDGGATRTTIEYIKQGETPAPRGYATQYITNSEIATFTGWSLPLEPLTKEFFDEHRTGSAVVYNATYSTEARLYKADFVSDGEILYTVNVPYEGIAEYKGEEIKVPDGYNYHFWLGLNSPVVNDVKYELVFTYNDPVQLEWAYATDKMSFSSSYTSDNNGNIIGEGAAVIAMAMEVRNAPNNTYSKRYRDRAVESLKYMVSDEGNAPYFELHPLWCYPACAAAISICKDTPSIWVRLSSEEQEKYDIIMRSFAYVLTLGTADANSYSTGPGLIGNFGKAWNPNYRLANVLPMLFVGQYFDGAANVDALLQNFSFDAAMADFAKYKCFTRAYNRWNTKIVDKSGNPIINPNTGKAYPDASYFMENGGPAYIFTENERLNYSGVSSGGSGEGVRVKYLYKGYNIDQVDEIMQSLLTYTYSGGAVWSDSKALGADGIYPSTALDQSLVGKSKAYILDGTTSPVEGLQGLMLEFNSGDGGNKVDGQNTSVYNGKNIRSSASYNTHNFMMVAASVMVLEELGAYDCDSGKNLDLYKKMWVGNTDFLYKMEHGYMSYSLGSAYENREGSGSNGYFLWKTWWNNSYGKTRPDGLK